jgi:hypothetical protein
VEGDVVRAALQDGNYPWYDRNTDKLIPVWPRDSGWQRSLGESLERALKSADMQVNRMLEAIKGFFRWLKLDRLPGSRLTGEAFMSIVLFAALFALLALLFWIGLRGQFFSLDRPEASSDSGGIARLADLPEDVWRGITDPWSEAIKRRAAGDLAGAVVFLFAYQLLSLNRVGLIRLVPGRTGRQYVETVRDPLLQAPAAATLGLFEEVYYGHREPRSDALDGVWTQAEAFRERLLRVAP